MLSHTGATNVDKAVEVDWDFSQWRQIIISYGFF